MVTPAPQIPPRYPATGYSTSMASASTPDAMTPNVYTILSIINQQLSIARKMS